MLTKEQQYLLFLLRKSLGAQTEAVDVPEDHDSITKAIWKCGILLSVYPFLPEALQTPLESRYLNAVNQAIQQDYEGNEVLEAIGKKGMSCIGLKGWELRKLYPEPAMRQMADLDVLVRPYRFSEIKSLMDEMGFSGGSESFWKHDSFRKGEVRIEMHKRLTDDSGKIKAWESAMWERAEPAELPNVYRMSPEDYVIFHFVHPHKDFLNGSLGLRRIADTWLLNKLPADMEQVKAALESFGMGSFHGQMQKLACAAMGERPMDNDSEFLLRHAFSTGIYGSNKSYKAGRIASMGENVRAGKFKSALAAAFLPYERMKAQFPILENCPVLLPICWVMRIARSGKSVLRRRKKLLNYSEITEGDFEYMKRFFKAGGV